jgi:hypothetical protein
MRILRVMTHSLDQAQTGSDGNTCPLSYPRLVDLPTELTVVVRGTEPPGRTFASYGDVHVGVQVGRESVGMVPADTAAPEWTLEVRYDGDFRGPAVHGKKGDRFLYLTWADRVGMFFHGFRRGKLMLDRIDQSVVVEAVEGGRTLVATVSLTDQKGGPRCARYDPPAIAWSVE